MPPIPPKRPSRWRAKAEEIRKRRAMKPALHAHLLPAILRNAYSHFYSNASGQLFAANATPFSTSHAGSIFIYELVVHPKKGLHERFMGEGSIHFEPEKHAIVIHQAKKEQSQVQLLEDRARIRGTRGIQLFRPILDYAIASAKKNGIHKIVLGCNPKLKGYYEKFGFKVVDLIYAHENTGAIVGYTMELSIS